MDTTQPPPEEACSALFELSPELDRIFATGIVVMKSDKPASSVFNIQQPATFAELKTILDSNQVTVPTNITTTHNEVNTVANIISNIDSKRKLSICIVGQTYTVNAPKSKDIEMISSTLLSYQTNLLSELDECDYFPNHVIDFQTLQGRITDVSDDISSRYATHRSFVKLLTSCILLERVTLYKDLDLLSRFQVTNPLSNQADTVLSRGESMIQHSVRNAAVNVVYNLSYNNLKHLASYILAHDPCVRLESKISLLSTTKGLTRSDIIRNPTKVLIQCFAESLMTDQEIVNFLFHRDDSFRCPTCTCILPQIPIHHNTCQIFEWLQKYLPFLISGSSINLTPIVQVNPKLKRMYKQIQDVRQQFLSTGISVSTPDNLQVFQLLDDNTISSKLLYKRVMPMPIRQTFRPHTRLS